MALYSVEVTERAKDHFRGHIGYIINKLRNPDAAWHLRDALDQAIAQLSSHPEAVSLCADIWVSEEADSHDAIFMRFPH